MQDLVAEGVITIPLYHGTSSLFAESIRARGLGACNPIADYGIVRFLKQVFPICEELFAANEEWICRRVVLEPMIRQEVTEGGFNFQHGDSYLTPSRSSAVGYALSNPFGSELISQAFCVLRMIETHRPGELERRGVSDDRLLKLFDQSPSPYLVMARNVPITFLSGECGDPVQEALQRLGDILDILDTPGVTINVNFRVTSPLPPDLLVVDEIDPKAEVNPYRD